MFDRDARSNITRCFDGMLSSKLAYLSLESNF